jgi:hypothetical protein
MHSQRDGVAILFVYPQILGIFTSFFLLSPTEAAGQALLWICCGTDA